MTVYLARTYVVNRGKLKEHNEWSKKLVALMKKNPGLFRDVDSLRVFKHKCPGSANKKFTALWGLANLDSIEGWESEFIEIPEAKALRTEFTELIVPGSYSACILNPIKTINRKTKPNRPKK